MSRTMKMSGHLLCLVCMCGFAAVIVAQPASSESKHIIRDAPKSEDLELARRKALAVDPMKNLEFAKGEDPEKANPPSSILGSSDIICFNGLATLVPKRAILVTPKAYEGYLKFQAGAKFVSWSEFYAKNRSWITTVEVSRLQAEGKEPVTNIQKNAIDKSRNLMVAVFSGGPISMLEQKHPAGDGRGRTNDGVKKNP